jgi:hypothetical protein
MQLTIEIPDDLVSVLRIINSLNNQRLGVSKTIEEFVGNMATEMLSTRKTEFLVKRAEEIKTRYIEDANYRNSIETLP